MTCQDATSDAADGNGPEDVGEHPPSKSDPPTGEPEPADQRAEGAGLGVWILLLDDDPNYAGPVVELMRRDGFTVDWCRTAEEAIESFREKGHALVLMELNLAGTPGDECARELRALDPAVEIVAVTTQATERGWRRRAEEAGIETVLHKTSAGYCERIHSLLVQTGERDQGQPGERQSGPA